MKGQGAQGVAATITIIVRKRDLFVASVAMSGNPRRVPITLDEAANTQ